MTPFPLPLEDGALFVSSSFLDKICPREQQYSKIEGREADRSGAGAIFGKHLHAALKAHYTKDGDPFAVLRTAFEATPTNDPTRSVEWAEELLTKYFERFGGDSWRVLRVGDKVEGKPASEFTFVTRLTTVENIPVFYRGIVDLAIELGERTGAVPDFKTGRMLGADYWDDKRILSQMRGYLWALGRVWPSREWNRYIIRAIRTKEKPLKFDTYSPAKQRDWWAESFGDQQYTVEPWELTEWHANACQLVTDFIRRAREGYYPMMRSACVRKYGKCDFYDVCAMRPETRAMMLSTDNFRARTSPLDSAVAESV